MLNQHSDCEQNICQKYMYVGYVDNRRPKVDLFCQSVKLGVNFPK